MSDFDLPDLPSDEELGITDADREAYADELGGDRPEMSEAEMRALLGDASTRPSTASASSSAGAKKSGDAAKAAKKAEKERKRAEKERKKAERERKRAEKRRAKEEKQAASAAASEGEGPTETESERAARIARAAGSGSTRPPGDAGAPPPGRKGEPPGSTAERPRRRWRGVLTLGFLLVVGIVTSSRTFIPGPAPANAPDTTFSSARAMSTLIEVATRAHPTGSPDHTRVRALLLERLRALGLEPEVQTTTSMIQQGPDARMATVRNIVARIPGADPTGTLLITAHYDGREIATAAGDDGVGVVTIVEAVRALLAVGQPRNDVIVLLTDGEELGLLGARAFVAEHEWFDEVSVVLSVEMRGSAGPSIMFETNQLNGWVVRAMKEFDPAPFANSLSLEVYRRMGRDTDFSPFRDAGKQGLNFGAIDNAHVYHQTYDVPQAVSESTVQHHGIHALAAARYFGQADLSNVNGDDVAYFGLPFLGLFFYPTMWSMVLSGLIVLLLGGAFFLARRGGARPSRIGIGAAVAVVAAALVFAGASALVGWLPRFHPEAGSLHGSLFHSEGWYMLALAGIAFTVVTAAQAIGRRWITTVDLALGAAVIPAVGAVVVGFVAPMAAHNLQWPVIAALVAIGTFALLNSRSDGFVGWIAALLLAAPVLLFFVHVIELVWLAFSIQIGAWLAVLMVFALLLSLPALDGLRHPNAWWAPLFGAAAAGIALGLGLVGSRSTDTRPAPSTLIYAYEHGTGTAVWATDASPDSADAPASVWAMQAAGGSFDATRDLSRFAYLPGQTPTVNASVVSAQPPEVVVARDSVADGRRYVTLHVRSRIGAEYMAFTYDDRGDTRLVTINGRPLAEPDRLEWVEHWGVPEPAVILELEMPEGEPIGLHVIEHLLRPEELLGSSAFERPPTLAPDITRMSDRAMFRYSVGAFVDPRYRIALPQGAPAGPLAADSTGTATDTLAPAIDTSGAVADSSGVAGPDTVVVDTTASDTTDTTAVDTLAVPDTADTVVIDTVTASDTVTAPDAADTTNVADSVAAPDTTDTIAGDTITGAATHSLRSSAARSLRTDIIPPNPVARSRAGIDPPLRRPE